MQEVMFPIVGYHEMNVSEVTEKLEGLSVEKLKRIRDYERRNKNRETVLERTLDSFRGYWPWFQPIHGYGVATISSGGA